MVDYSPGLTLNQIGIREYIFTHALQHKVCSMLGAGEQKSVVNVPVA